MPKTTILAIDPSGDTLPKVSAAVRPFSTRILWADNFIEGKRLVSEGRPDIILVKNDAPGFEGDPTEILNILDALRLPAQVIVMTDEPDFERAMELVNSGVFSVLALPLSVEKLRGLAKKVFENLSLLNTLVENGRVDGAKELHVYKKLAGNQDLPSLAESVREAASELFDGAPAVLELSEELSSHMVLPETEDPDGEDGMFSFDAENPPQVPETHNVVRELSFKNLALGTLKLSLPPEIAALANDPGRNPERLPGEEGTPADDIAREKAALDELVWAASLHLYQAKRYHDAVRLASKDPLTSLLNRRVFMETLDREFAKAKRHNTPLSLIILDIDHFKNVNDTFGHQTGDSILKWLSGVLSNTIRTGDVLGRIGGEEFAVLLPWTDPEQARKLASRIREALAESPLPTPHKLLRPTVSQGISSLEHFLINSPEDLIYWSDQAMYLAKKEGRDAFRLASEIQPKTRFEETPYVFQ
ncbi:MAG: diguanylate cyclase [Deltaproteobacteria bacterium]|jgi:diguanylate cyclase (GGDEF)-like protein|nr:diguanylate cyclase [Deltaproteobacteria bacterium]